MMTTSLVGTYPTPVERLVALSRPGCDLWVKRDDLTHASYGGNKVRKLERILAEAKKRGARRIVTIGAAGSHHVLATTIFAQQEGIGVDAVLVPQPKTEHVVSNLRAFLGHDLKAFPAGSFAGVPLAVVRRLLAGKDVLYVPVGGSSVLGAMGYVDAARELAEQVRAGAMPEPDLIVVTLGSGGTAGGLAAGLAAEKLKTRVVAVSVSTPVWAVAMTARSLARRCARQCGASASNAVEKLMIDARYLGPGYGHSTPWGEHAREVAHEVGLHVDPTYTAKTFAAALDLVSIRRAKTILYWHTLSSAPMAPLLEGAPDESALAQDVVRLLR
jgi:1-aminocyclopropane-1-carboxylate deaminase/D-cysteine desulfhydrase-like pyridoxal-dependent ACC family enzyme